MGLPAPIVGVFVDADRSSDAGIGDRDTIRREDYDARHRSMPQWGHGSGTKEALPRTIAM